MTIYAEIPTLIKAWKTSDGSFFESREKADSHEMDVGRAKRIEAWVNDHLPETLFWLEDRKEEVIEALIEYGKEIEI